MTTLKIKVTKQILEESKYCGMNMQSCAVARAVRDIFPNASVHFKHIFPFGTLEFSHESNVDKIVKKLGVGGVINLPEDATDFIRQFDSCPNICRSSLPEIEFEISIPDEVIEKININEITPLLQNHPTLELITN